MLRSLVRVQLAPPYSATDNWLSRLSSPAIVATSGNSERLAAPPGSSGRVVWLEIPRLVRLTPLANYDRSSLTRIQLGPPAQDRSAEPKRFSMACQWRSEAASS
jgi:hypothetical protein